MQSVGELLLNLCWLAISGLALFTCYLDRLAAELVFAGSSADAAGLLVVICMLALLFPVISISDDLSQTLSLAEGSRLQDVLKAPELRGIYCLAAILPTTLQLASQSQTVMSTIGSKPAFVLHDIFWAPAIDNRPPPHSA